MWNIGENLDALMNLDPRGYGVCRILYEGSRAHVGEPIAMSAAKALCQVVKEGDLVYILTGFILRPYKVPEMDGFVSSVLLARALVAAFGAKPIVICPDECKDAMKQCANTVGLHIYEDIELLKEMPMSMGIATFTKDLSKAPARADELLELAYPAAVISVEAPGANAHGEYHNAVGVNMTELEAKTDVLWNKIREKNIFNIAIGDLGNEIGMGSIADHILKYVPFTGSDECKCECKGGILSASTTDHIITAVCSDWGCYALISGIAYIKKNIEIVHDEAMEEEVMRTAARNGMIDMTGSLLPGVDGFDLKMNVSILSLMRQCTGYAIRYSHNSDHWFGPVLEKKFFQKMQGGENV